MKDRADTGGAVPEALAPDVLALSPAEAARRVSIPKPTLYDLIRRGEIAVSVYGGSRHRRRYLIQLADLEAWLRRTRVAARWEAAETKPLRAVMVPGDLRKADGSP